LHMDVQGGGGGASAPGSAAPPESVGAQSAEAADPEALTRSRLQGLRERRRTRQTSRSSRNSALQDAGDGLRASADQGPATASGRNLFQSVVNFATSASGRSLPVSKPSGSGRALAVQKPSGSGRSLGVPKPGAGGSARSLPASTSSRDRERDAAARPTLAEGNEGQEGGENQEGGEEDDAEMPEDLAGLSPEEQFRRLAWRACWKMGLGSVLIILFSDPLVDALAQLAGVMTIPPFYVSFVVAPFASNASEMIAAYNFSLRKSPNTITAGLATLLGAAVMNNTLVLAVFLGIIKWRGLDWTFSAETISILLVEMIVCAVAMLRVQTVRVATAVLTLFPLCVLFVWLLEGPGGLN